MLDPRIWRDLDLIRKCVRSQVLYFYPADNSPGCTKQANAFKSGISALKKAGAEGDNLLFGRLLTMPISA